MKYDKPIEGKYCDLRSVELEDAEFTLAMRKDPSLTAYLPKLDITVEQQRDWIKKQQADPTDYFFVVVNKNGNRIGVMGLYNIENGEGETGRLAMKGNPLQAIESQMLCVDFAFYVLKLKGLHSYIAAENDGTIRFAKMFGPIISEPRINEKGEAVVDATNSLDTYMKAKPKLERMLYREGKNRNGKQ